MASNNWIMMLVKIVITVLLTIIIAGMGTILGIQHTDLRAEE